MKLTNNHHLPAPLVSAVKNDGYTKQGNISVTGLLGAPRKRLLTSRHFNELEEDVSDRIWSLLGQAVHAVLQRSDTDNHLSEERMSVTVNGWKVSGQFDLYSQDGVLDDYKVTSVYSFLLGEKPEWTAQLNVYAWMLRQQGFPVKQIRIVAILRDWSSSKAMGSGYPQAPVMVVEVPIWPDSEVKTFVEAQVARHQAAESLSDDSLPLCSPEERWERPTSYAVMKKGGKRATRVFDDIDHAKEFVGDVKGMDIVERPGESVMCQRFCGVNKFCNQFVEAEANG